jgi:undecaprenyl diphosphate synthase
MAVDGIHMPEHIAVIMDGNGRWATARGLPRIAGHQAGARAVRSVVESARKNGIKILTLFAFSSENWRRPRAEVRMLMDLLRRTIGREIAALEANGVRLNFVGARHQFSPAMRNTMIEAEARTAANRALELVVAIDYGGRWDIVQAARAAARACAAGELAPEAIDEAGFARYLSLSRFPQPDLFIRTGGERRISNFLLWDLAYCELYFTDLLWPEFDGQALRAAIAWYARRDRRFGRLSPDAAAKSS